MKRFLAGVALFAVMTLSACSSGIISGRPDIDKPFSAEARIAIGGETVTGTVSRNADKSWTLSLSEPYALEGLSLTFCDGKTTFSMQGFTCTGDFSDSAVSSLKLLAEAYEGAVQNPDGFAEGVFGGTNENGVFSVAVDENGMPALITAGDISVQLSQWTENAEIMSGGEELILLE